jgi:hypothetical protein
MTPHPDVNPDYTDIRVDPSDVQQVKKNYAANGWDCVNDTVVEKETGKIFLQFRRTPKQA